MTVSQLRLMKTETRDIGERMRNRELNLGETEPWAMSNSAFFVAFVAIAASIALLALLLRAG